MKKLTRKFKEGFRSYDYNEQDIDILLSMLDAILEMMGIVELQDSENLKKLSSFTSLLSSGYSKTIIEAATIEDIYINTILPVLDEFDKKYSQKVVAITSKEIVNGIPRVEVFTDERVLAISNDFCNGDIDANDYMKMIREESARYKSKPKNIDSVEETAMTSICNVSDVSFTEDINQLNKFVIDNMDTDDPDIKQVIFNMSKDMISILQNIYDSFTNGISQEHNERYINDLILLRNTMEIVSRYDDMSIQLISDVIRSVCYSLIHEIKVNGPLPPSSIMMIELKFKSLEGLKYKV